MKDRIAKRMIEEAERSGRLKKGDTLIEPTSGNTGIGLAMAAATKGYRCIIVLPEKMSKEKVDVLKALGAEIVRTPTEAAYDAPDSHISVAKRLNAEIPNSHILDQYSNVANPDAHYHGTAEEIWVQTGGKVDMVVAGAGTGGTITGIAKKLKERNPSVKIVGVDPVGSVLAVPDSLNDPRRLEPYHVEGIGYDFVPDVLDRSVVDVWMKSDDAESFVTMRKLIRYEGLLCGGSCGAAVSCALKAAESLRDDQTCVVILPDSVRNYMTKALSDDWMIDRSFVDDDVVKPREYKAWWADRRVCDLRLRTPLTITGDVTCKSAIALLKSEGFDMVPVIDSDGDVAGVVTEGNMTSQLLSGRAMPDETVVDAGVVYKTFRKFGTNDRLADVARALDSEPYALIVVEQRCYDGKRKQGQKRRKRAESVGSEEGSTATELSDVVTRTVVSGIVTRIDLLDYISTGEQRREEGADDDGRDGDEPHENGK